MAICKKGNRTGNGTGNGMGNGMWNGTGNQIVHLLLLMSLELCFTNRFFQFFNNLSNLEHCYLK